MIISNEKYCIASNSFPLKFYKHGNEFDALEESLLMDIKSCEDELKTYDEPEDYFILKVLTTYEF